MNPSFGSFWVCGFDCDCDYSVGFPYFHVLFFLPRLSDANGVAFVRISDLGDHAPVVQVKHGVMFDRREAEGTKRRHQVDTVIEGM